MRYEIEKKDLGVLLFYLYFILIFLIMISSFKFITKNEYKVFIDNLNEQLHSEHHHDHTRKNFSYVPHFLIRIKENLEDIYNK